MGRRSRSALRERHPPDAGPSVADPGCARSRAGSSSIARSSRSTSAGSPARSTSRSCCASSTTASGPCSGGCRGTAEAEWLPFLVLVTVLVFWRGGLYAPREQRAGAGRIVSSLLLVTVITLAFAVGTGYQHTTFGLYVTAFVLSVVVVGGLRSALRARDARRLAARGRAPARGARSARATGSLELRRALGLGRGGIDYEFLGAIVVGRRRRSTCRRSDRSRDLPQRPRAPASRRADRQRRRPRRRGVARSRRAGAPLRREGAHRADDDRAADAARASTSRARACRSSSCGRRCSPGSTGRSKRTFDLV